MDLVVSFPTMIWAISEIKMDLVVSFPIMIWAINAVKSRWI